MEGVYRKQREKAIALRRRESVRAKKRKRERERKRNGWDGSDAGCDWACLISHVGLISVR